MTGIAEEKAALRRAAKLSRAAAAQAAEDAAARFLERLLDAVQFLPLATVSAYWPMSDELDVRPTMQSLHERGNRIALPVMLGPARPLLFRQWKPGQALQAAAFGTSEPPADAPISVPEVLIVPLLAFDRKGYRLGYGGGFYDRTLAELRSVSKVQAVGAAYAGQEVDDVPREATDLPLDWIVTEEDVIRIGGAALT